ncbi:MAG TPA: hypothetical protein VGH28_24250 [Polyangiaceae bacterium]
MSAAQSRHENQRRRHDAKGALPLYVFVYVPNALHPITSGAVCTSCQAPASGKPLVVATTDERGHFELADVPDAAARRHREGQHLQHQFMARGGRILLADSGAGVAHRDLPHVFDRF